jgi:hypothetical protein
MSVNPHKPTAFQMLALVTEMTGKKIELREGQSLLAIKMTSDSIVVTIEKLRIRETARELSYVGRTLQMISFVKPAGTDKWTFAQNIQCEDESYKPTTVIKYGRVETPAEYLARVGWERDCTAPAPGIETYSKTYDDASYGQAARGMLRHWGIDQAAVLRGDLDEVDAQ